jgi:CheY-like chemotaxis protein
MNSEEIKILLADDDRDDCLFFKEALEELRLTTQLITQLTMVHDGEQLMRLLKKTAGLPHVLFLDLNMPRKNGFTCLQEIKSDDNLTHLPIIIYSTSFDKIVADRLYQNGAQYYICKPTDFSNLKKVIYMAVTLSTEKNHSQPPRENFSLSNLKAILL